jgi:uncharacterized protein (TIGR02246 family)
VSDVSRLYHALLEAWNARDAAAFAALFADAGHVVGYDGSEMHGPTEIEKELGSIFADHDTGTYVASVRGEEHVTRDVRILRAAAGLVPAGGSELNPALNAVQTLVAARQEADWRIVLFQNTPAQLHGRPELADALTDELRRRVPKTAD